MVRQLTRHTHIKSRQYRRSLEGITALGVDEISAGKRHKYWHMVHALDGQDGAGPIYVGESRK